MSAKVTCIGIDLGTTYSCMAYVDEFDRAVVIRNFEGTLTTPSVVAFSGDTPIVGLTAKESAASDPTRVVQFAKRFMGTQERFMIDEKSYSSEEVSAYILKKLILDAERELGYRVDSAVITVPAYFGVNERMATKLAGELAGIKVTSIIPEPIAAAIAYGNIDTNKNVLVYDLGGGTFDVTLIKFTPTCFDSLLVDGDHELGGKDWDQCLINHFVALFADETGTDDAEMRDDPETMASLRELAEKTKHHLSTREVFNVSISHAGVRLKAAITRDEFDSMTNSLLVRTISLTKAVMDEAKERFGISMPDEILLVGGSTRMLQVAKAVQDLFGMEPKKFDPDEAVAKGAAIAAKSNELIGQLEKVFGSEGVPADLSDVTQLPLDKKVELEKIAESQGTSVEALLGGSTSATYTTLCSKSFGMIALDSGRAERVFTLIKNNTKLPATVEREFSTVDEGQLNVAIRVVETKASGEVSEVEDSKEIGKGSLEFGRAMPRNTPLNVKFTMAQDGTLDITANEISSGASVNFSIETPDVVSGEELEEARERVGSAVSF